MRRPPKAGGWRLVVDLTPERLAIVSRRFGRRHAEPCANPNTLTCALPKCQSRNRRQFLAGRAALEAKEGDRDAE